MIEQLLSDLIKALNENTAALSTAKTPEAKTTDLRAPVAPITPSDPVTPVVTPITSLLIFPEPINPEAPTLLECENIMAYLRQSHGQQLCSDILESWSLSTLTELPLECYADFITFTHAANTLYKGH